MRICLLVLFSFIILRLDAQIITDTVFGYHSECDTIPYDPSMFFIIDSVIPEGNKVTKDHIITRELLFGENDTVCKINLEYCIRKSRENLLNTSLFNFVTIDTLPSGKNPNGIKVQIHLIERWYIWPFPIFELSDRNFNAWWETKDFRRVSYGAFITWENFRGRKETLKLRLRFGYDEQYDIFYTIPYINKKETLGFGFGGGIAMNHEVACRTYRNKLQYYRDNDEYIRKKGFSFVQLTYRKIFYNTHKFQCYFNYNYFADDLLQENEHYSTNNQNILRFFSLYYQFKSDHRDYKSYPLTGYYFDVGIEKKGFGIFKGNDLDVFYILSTFRKYWQFQKRIYFAFGLNSKLSTSSEQPYFLVHGLGYGRDYIRSYELYVIDGQNFGLLKTNFKFALLPTRVTNIKFIKTEKFRKIHYAIFMNLFADVAYVDNIYPDPELMNNLENKILFGYGLGIDFVTYYDVVIRVEFSINRMHEKGFFLHFMAPI
jgi:outer membrane protein assembly factor BamA